MGTNGNRTPSRVHYPQKRTRCLKHIYTTRYGHPQGKGKSRGALYEGSRSTCCPLTLHALQQRMGIAPKSWMTPSSAVTPIGDQGYNIAKAALLHAGWEGGQWDGSTATVLPA